MKPIAALLFVSVCLLPSWADSSIPGDAKRGANTFREKRCGSCHSLRGKGGNVAPDLASEPAGRFTPSLLAVAIWNHGPKMWARMKMVGADRQQISYQEAADLFAYVYTFRYFEEPGDAGRGKRIFDSKGCVGCHAQGTAGASAPLKWEASNDPVQLARIMWNHAGPMAKAQGAGKPWPELTAQELTDLLAYVRATGQAPRSPNKLALASPVTGEMLFQAKGCGGCHTGAQALGGRTGARTFAELAVAMWNHAPKMRQTAQEIRPEEMTRLVGYLWSIQYFDGAGDPAKGLGVAVNKGCISCHGDPKGATPRFSSWAGKMDDLRFIAGAWDHSAGMQEAMKKAGIQWPELKRDELVDLLAYINSL